VFHNRYLGWGPTWAGLGGWHFFNYRPHPYYWWGWSSPYRLTTWFTWGPRWTYPVYYDYGTVIYYDDYFVYVDDEPIATGPQYAYQAIELASQGREIIVAKPPVAEYTDPSDWLPLGMFALANEDEGSPIMYLQLAVDQDGVISGTYFNSLTESTLPIYGMVDPESQRAAWSVGDKTTTVMETGIFNLTEDIVPLLLVDHDHPEILESDGFGQERMRPNDYVDGAFRQPLFDFARLLGRHKLKLEVSGKRMVLSEEFIQCQRDFPRVTRNPSRLQTEEVAVDCPAPHSRGSDCGVRCFSRHCGPSRSAASPFAGRRSPGQHKSRGPGSSSRQGIPALPNRCTRWISPHSRASLYKLTHRSGRQPSNV
jgi:hypothetical protein